MELIPNEGLPRLAICEPAGIEVEAGKVYSWCSCGLSEKEPFCDNTHRNIEGLPFRSVKVVFDKAASRLVSANANRPRHLPFVMAVIKLLVNKLVIPVISK